MIVIDASAAIELLLNTRSAARIAERVFAADESLHAPHLIDLEVLQVLRRYLLAKELTAARAQQAMEDLNDLVLHRYAHSDLAPRIWALRNSLTAYDAAYVSLAEALNAKLITRDVKLGNSHGHRARIEVV